MEMRWCVNRKRVYGELRPTHFFVYQGLRDNINALIICQRIIGGFFAMRILRAFADRSYIILSDSNPEIFASFLSCSDIFEMTQV